MHMSELTWFGQRAIIENDICPPELGFLCHSALFGNYPRFFWLFYIMDAMVFLTFWYDVFVYVAILLVSRELYPLVSQSRVLLAHHHHEHFLALQFPNSISTTLEYITRTASGTWMDSWGAKRGHIRVPIRFSGSQRTLHYSPLTIIRRSHKNSKVLSHSFWKSSKKVSFNIASEASYVYVFEWTKVH